MKKQIFLFSIFASLSFLCCCGLTHTENEKADAGEDYSDLTENESQEVWEYLDIEAFQDINSSVEGTHFLITEEISLEEPVYQTEQDNTDILLKLFQNLSVKKDKRVNSCADFYVLFRNENDTAICLIEVWPSCICVNQNDFYKVQNDELYLAITQMLSECRELDKIPAEEILLTYANDGQQDKYTEEDIVLWHDQPAILVENGYADNLSEEKLYYEKYICCNGLYIDIDYQTTYMLSQYKIFYYEDGSVQDSYYERAAYYDYFSGKRILFPY